MWSSREAFENDVCPVGDEMLGSLYRASEHGLPQLVESVSADVRAMLALFCYRRAHLHGMSLAIAATCTERDLVEQGGIVGSTLFAMSREAPSAGPAASAYGSRRNITLSTKPLSTFAPLADEIEDESDLAAMPAQQAFAGCVPAQPRLRLAGPQTGRADESFQL